MKSLNYIIIESGQEYNNEVELSNGSSLVVNTTIESVANVNRIVKVVSAPEETILQSGDMIVIHHNILRMKNGVEGIEVKSDFHIKDDLYYVPPTEVFAYKRNGEWKALDPFVFVKPALSEGISEGVIEAVTFQKYEPNKGTIQIINEQLQDWGLKKGDEILFKNESEYEFEVEGKLLYRMRTSDILGKFQ